MKHSNICLFIAAVLYLYEAHWHSSIHRKCATEACWYSSIHRNCAVEEDRDSSIHRNCAVEEDRHSSIHRNCSIEAYYIRLSIATALSKNSDISLYSSQLTYGSILIFVYSTQLLCMKHIDTRLIIVTALSKRTEIRLCIATALPEACSHLSIHRNCAIWSILTIINSSQLPYWSILAFVYSSELGYWKIVTFAYSSQLRYCSILTIVDSS